MHIMLFYEMFSTFKTTQYKSISTMQGLKFEDAQGYDNNYQNRYWNIMWVALRKSDYIINGKRGLNSEYHSKINKPNVNPHHRFI